MAALLVDEKVASKEPMMVGLRAEKRGLLLVGSKGSLKVEQTVE